MGRKVCDECGQEVRKVTWVKYVPNELKACFVRRGFSMAEVADELGMHRQGFHAVIRRGHMRKKLFDEIAEITNLNDKELDEMGAEEFRKPQRGA